MSSNISRVEPFSRSSIHGKLFGLEEDMDVGEAAAKEAAVTEDAVVPFFSSTDHETSFGLKEDMDVDEAATKAEGDRPCESSSAAAAEEGEDVEGLTSLLGGFNPFKQLRDKAEEINWGEINLEEEKNGSEVLSGMYMVNMYGTTNVSEQAHPEVDTVKGVVLPRLFPVQKRIDETRTSSTVVAPRRRRKFRTRKGAMDSFRFSRISSIESRGAAAAAAAVDDDEL